MPALPRSLRASAWPLLQLGIWPRKAPCFPARAAAPGPRPPARATHTTARELEAQGTPRSQERLQMLLETNFID